MPIWGCSDKARGGGVIRKKKEWTEKDIFDQKIKEEVDLQFLQREFVIQIGNKNSYVNKPTFQKATKYNTVINHLKTELENIYTDIVVAKSPFKLLQDKQITDDIVSLLNEYDELNCRIDYKKKIIGLMNAEFAKKRRLMIKMQGTSVSDHNIQSRILNGQNTLAGLENRLDTQVKKYSTIMSDNALLREQITHLMQERQEFNKQWGQMVHRLEIGKQLMLDLIEQTSKCYDAREECIKKLEALTNRALSDYYEDRRVMCGLMAKHDNNSKLHEFYETKNQRRIMVDIEAKNLVRFAVHKKEKKERLAHYRKLLNDINTYLESCNLDEKSYMFNRLDANNFAVFENIIAINRDTEFLSDELLKIHYEIDDAKSHHSNRQIQQELGLESLRLKVEGLEIETNSTMSQVEEVDEKLNKIYSGIDQIFKMLNCSDEPILKLLDTHSPVNEHNVFVYLKIIEENFNNMLVRIHYVEDKDVKAKKLDKKKTLVAMPYSFRPKIEQVTNFVVTTCPLCVEHENVNDIIDTQQRILRRPQVKVLLEQKLRTPGLMDVLHNFTQCVMPKARQLVQKVYR